MEKTAVDFIIETLAKNGILHSSDINKAKAMEKEQMEKMYSHAMWALVDGNGHGQGFDEFYKETFKSE